MTCAKGRFLKKRPYHGGEVKSDSKIFDLEVNIVVADICPHGGNEVWCPKSPGDKNEYDAVNHLDFVSPPEDFDNYYFAFTPAPCSEELQGRIAKMSMCGKW